MLSHSKSSAQWLLGRALIGVSVLSAHAVAQTQVITVPWQGDPLQQHQTYSGASLVLQGTAVPGVGCTLVSATWDFGDGSPVSAVSVANPRVLEATHVYNGPTNQPFTATLSVLDSCGNTVTDAYRVVILNQNLNLDVNMAIDRGLWNLHKREVLSSIGGVSTGYWSSASPYSQNRAAATASAIQAMAVHGHLATSNPNEDPYADDVARALAHLPSELASSAIAVQTAGNPDTNGNGIGLYVPADAIYVGGQVIDAFVSSGTPNAVALTGSSPFVLGRTYADIVQDILEMYAWGQTDSGSRRGGWRYSFNSDADNSACQWWAIGGIAAERVFGTVIPQWVKDENLNYWLAYSQFMNGTHTGNDGSYGYTDPQYFAWDAGMNTTPSGLVQLVLSGVPSTDARFIRANEYIARNWSVLINNNRLYGMFATAKANRLANPPVTHLTSPGISIDWYNNDILAGDPINGVARKLVTSQLADGSWDEQLVWDDLATAWAVVILSSTIVQVGPVAVPKANPSTTAATFPVTFTGAFSYHPDPARAIVNYEWDFENDGTYDATGISVVHTYPVTGVYTARLRVTDDTTPNALQSTGTTTVNITPPPFPPDSNPGGPYSFCLQYQPWILDGSQSSDPDGSVVSYEWDFSPTPPLNFGDATGQFADATSHFVGLAPGVYDVALRVTDNNTLTDVDFTTVRVLGPNDPCPGQPVVLNCPPDYTDVYAGGIPAGQTLPAVTGTATYTDNCFLGVNLSYQDISIVPNTPQNPGAPEVVITRRWTLTDGCGALQTCDQIITLLSAAGLTGNLMVDAQPNQCPNDVWPTSADTKFTIPGTWRHAAATIDPTSIRIHRADSIGKEIRYGNYLYGATFTDITRPYYGQNGPCNTLGPDGRPDLTVRISSRALRSLLRLNSLANGTQVNLVITGKFTNGDSFSSMEWIVVRQ